MPHRIHVTDSMVISLSSTLITSSIYDVTLFSPSPISSTRARQPDRLITGFVQLNSSDSFPPEFYLQWTISYCGRIPLCIY